MWFVLLCLLGCMDSGDRNKVVWLCVAAVAAKLLCPLLSPLCCALQIVVIYAAVTVHILELLALPAFLTLSLS